MKGLIQKIKKRIIKVIDEHGKAMAFWGLPFVIVCTIINITLFALLLLREHQ
jgi:hypothetical protein